MVSSDALFHEWCEALAAAFSIALADRRRTLDRRRGSTYNGQGLNSYSEEWGRVLACEALFPGLAELRFASEPYCTPIGMRNVANDEADREWAERLVEA